MRPQTLLPRFDFWCGSAGLLRFTSWWLALSFQLQSYFLSLIPVLFVPGSSSSQGWGTPCEPRYSCSSQFLETNGYLLTNGKK